MLNYIGSPHDVTHQIIEYWQHLIPVSVVASHLQHFLRTFNRDGRYVYMDKIRLMVERNHSSFYVNVGDLLSMSRSIGVFLVHSTDKFLTIFHDVAKQLVLEINPYYEDVTNEIHVRISDSYLLSYQLKSGTRVECFGILVRTAGIVTAATTVSCMPWYIIDLVCDDCGFVVGPVSVYFYTRIESLPGWSSCPMCLKKVPFSASVKKTSSLNHQIITIQEFKHTVVSCGEITTPSFIDCVFVGDLCGRYEPGDKIDVTGIVSKAQNCSAEKVLLANYLCPYGTDFENKLTAIKNHHQPAMNTKIQVEALREELKKYEILNYIEPPHDASRQIVEYWQYLIPETVVATHFKSFLRTFCHDGRFVYMDKIRLMCEKNHTSFEVNFHDLVSMFPKKSSKGLLQSMDRLLTIFHEAAKQLVLEINPNYKEITDEIHVRISNFRVESYPMVSGRRIKCFGAPVRTAGIVTAATTVSSMPWYITDLVCNNCGFVGGPITAYFYTSIESIYYWYLCRLCLKYGPLSKNIKKTSFISQQMITIQEFEPAVVPYGKVETPSFIECILFGDLCGMCEPGDKIDVTGVLSSTLNCSSQEAILVNYLCPYGTDFEDHLTFLKTRNYVNSGGFCIL